MNEKYYLVPGGKIGNKNLPGGKLESKKDYVEIDDKYVAVIKNSLPYLVSQGVLVTSVPSESVEDSGKSEKRLALESEATELGLEFTDKTTQKELTAMIESALAGEGIE